MKRKLFYALVLVASMMMPLAGEAAETEETGAETEAQRALALSKISVPTRRWVPGI